VKSFFSFILSLLLIVVIKAEDSHAKSKNPEPVSRQRSLIISDIDGSLLHNIGAYRLFRVRDTQDSFFPEVAGLPEMVRVPVDDYEGNIGTQIKSRLGRILKSGKFQIGTDHSTVKLSNGAEFVPAYYRLDDIKSFEEFRPAEGDLKNSFFYKALKEANQNENPYLLEASIFLSLIYSGDYADRLEEILLTLRGNSDTEIAYGLEKQFRDRFKLGSGRLKTEAIVNLNHPEHSEYGGSKATYLTKAYFELTRRVMWDHKTSHYFVFIENDRKMIAEMHDLFAGLSNRGEFSNPVIPILINLVEPEVFQNPDGITWGGNPTETISKMSRVTVYRPGKIERSNDLGKVLELILGISSKNSARLISEKLKKLPLCRNVFSEGVNRVE
jgi:hypothetical protein